MRGSADELKTLCWVDSGGRTVSKLKSCFLAELWGTANGGDADGCEAAALAASIEMVVSETG